MVDPQPLPQIPLSRPSISEAAIADVAEVLRSGWITSGPKVLEFEKNFAAATGSAHALTACSATAALDMIFQALELQPGDEVITPSINWVSAPNMIELNGGTTVFCDVDATTLNLDLADVARRITPRTRAIVPVHFAGAPCDLNALRRLVAGTSIRIIEDAAHAAGAQYAGRMIGSDSDIAVFSFHPTKNITTAEGGMVTCSSSEFASQLRLNRFHGIRKDAWKGHGRGGKDVYQVLAPGRKYNLTDIQAVLGIHQLRDLPRLNAERARLAGLYQRHLAGLRMLTPLRVPDAPGTVHAWHIYVVLFELERMRVGRNEIVGRLESLGINTALHFPAVHTQDYYAKRYPGLELPVSARVSDRLLSLPLFPGMADADVERVAAALHSLDREFVR